jgi:uncharacterized protein YndB with AHSA1/START domain
MSEPVVLERHFAHSPTRVFEAWTDIEVLCRWFGCGVDMLWDIHEWDVRKGGALRVSLDYDGKPFMVEGGVLTGGWTSSLSQLEDTLTFAEGQHVD